MSLKLKLKAKTRLTFKIQKIHFRLKKKISYLIPYLKLSLTPVNAGSAQFLQPAHVSTASPLPRPPNPGTLHSHEHSVNSLNDWFYTSYVFA